MGKLFSCSVCGKSKGFDKFLVRDRLRLRRHNTATCRACIKNAARRAFTKANPDYNRRSQFRTRYGLSLDAYYKMLQSQGSKCAICGTAPGLDNRGRPRLTIDHCHKSGKVRSLLCNSCNLILGHAKDSVKILRRSIAYLNKHKCRNATSAGKK